MLTLKMCHAQPCITVNIFETFYCKDTEPLIPCFHVLTSNTSFQYLLPLAHTLPLTTSQTG